MTSKQQNRIDNHFMRIAYQEAKAGYDAGGCPIGAVLVSPDNTMLGKGHNHLVQESNPILHGEMSALSNAGRIVSRAGCTMYTTLSPCMMCTGAIIQFNISTVVIGYEVPNSNVEFLKKNNITVRCIHDPLCEDLVNQFKQEKPDLWLEDWGGK